MRPGWDHYFMAIADAVSKRADCTRAQVGAVIVNKNRIVSTGYNGTEPGGASCLAGACPRGRSDAESGGHGYSDFSNCINLHAEQNAIAWARERGDTIYVTKTPCDMCAKLIKAAGIVRVVTPLDLS